MLKKITITKEHIMNVLNLTEKEYKELVDDLIRAMDEECQSSVCLQVFIVDREGNIQ